MNALGTRPAASEAGFPLWSIDHPTSPKTAVAKRARSFDRLATCRPPIFPTGIWPVDAKWKVCRSDRPISSAIAFIPQTRSPRSGSAGADFVAFSSFSIFFSIKCVLRIYRGKKLKTSLL
jgi:hypothetical protein